MLNHIETLTSVFQIYAVNILTTVCSKYYASLLKCWTILELTSLIFQNDAVSIITMQWII